MPFIVRNTKPSDFGGILELARRVQPRDFPWDEKLLEAQLEIFPEGQFIAVDSRGIVVGMMGNLVILWEDYGLEGDWAKHTDSGHFTSHDIERGRTLYCAHLVVLREQLVTGIVAKLCDARRRLAKKMNLFRIRTAVPLYEYKPPEMTPEEFVESVLRGTLDHPLLTLQLRRGLEVLAVLPQYFTGDSSDAGYAALLEWRNPAWSPADVGYERATKGPDYSFRSNVHRIRRSRI
jgi:hypothetical protein